MNLTDITPEMVEHALERTGLNLISGDWVERGELSCGCVLSVIAIDQGFTTLDDIEGAECVSTEMSRIFAAKRHDIEAFIQGFDGEREEMYYPHAVYETGRAIRQHFIAKGYEL